MGDTTAGRLVISADLQSVELQTRHFVAGSRMMRDRELIKQMAAELRRLELENSLLLELRRAGCDGHKEQQNRIAELEEIIESHKVKPAMVAMVEEWGGMERRITELERDNAQLQMAAIEENPFDD